MKKIFTLILSFVLINTYAQNNGCTVLLQRAAGFFQDSVYCGIPFTVQANIQTTTFALNNNFNNQTLGNGWTATSGFSFNNPCGPSPSGVPGDFYLWMGQNVPIPRTLTTVPFDLRCGGNICFNLRFAIQGQTSPCEGPDLVDEGVSLQYRTCPTCPWTNVVYYNPNGTTMGANPGPGGGGISGPTPYTVWNTFCITIPPAAWTSTTQFRWIQEAYSSQQNDHWGLDNIQITAVSCGPFFNIWSPNTGISDSTTTQFTTAISSDATYYITVKDSTNLICTDTLRVPVRNLKLRAIATDSVICENQQIQLNAQTFNTQSPNALNIYQWLWTPDTFLTNQNIRNPFSTPNRDINYAVQLSVPGHPSCTKIDTIPIDVSILTPPTIIKVGETCDGFNDGAAKAIPTSGRAPFTYQWNSTPIQNQDTAFNLSPGIVTVTVTDSLGCITTTDVSIDEAPPFQFNFAHSDNQCLSGNQFTMIPSGTMAPDVTYNWNFGTDPLDYPGNTMTHSYTNPGKYTIRLVAVNSKNCRDTVKKDIIVYNQPDMNFTFENACRQTPVKLYDSTYVVNADTSDFVKNYFWYFGDNTILPSTNKNTSHYYTNDGVYNVKLKVITNLGCVDSISKQVQTYPLPVARFSAIDACENTATRVNDLSTLKNPFNIISRMFNFDHSRTDAIRFGTNAEYTYDSSGVYGVSLIVTSEHGCKDSVYKNVTVHPAPKIDFTSDLTVGCSPLSVNFDENVTIKSGAIKGFLWDFGNGNTTDAVNPNFTYTESGNYNIKLVAVSERGCLGVLQKNNYIVVHPKPKSDFEATPIYASLDNPFFTFKNTTTNANSITWSLGNAFPISNTNNDVLTYKFDKEGAYPVTLTATNQFGCADEITKTVYVENTFKIFIPNSFTPNNDGKNDIFQVYGEGIVDFQMVIMNRLGQPVFKSDNIDQFWDGFNENKTDFLPTGVYVYRIVVFDKYGKSHEYKGHVNLIK